MDKKLEFKIKGTTKGVATDPRWREVGTENTRCDICKGTMVVILGNKGILYAYCGRCQKYFIGE